MATPEFIVRLREKIGHDPLWIPGVTVVVVRPSAEADAADSTGTADTPGSADSAHVVGAQNAADTAGNTDNTDRPASAPALDVLLVRRVDNGQWTPITGIVDPGEHPHLAAIREAKEEAGVDIAICSLLGVQAVGPVTYPNGDVTSYVDTAFRAELTPDSPEAQVSDDESSELGWFPLSHLPKLKGRFRAIINQAARDYETPIKATWGPQPE